MTRINSFVALSKIRNDLNEDVLGQEGLEQYDENYSEDTLNLLRKNLRNVCIVERQVHEIIHTAYGELNGNVIRLIQMSRRKNNLQIERAAASSLGKEM